MTSEDRFVGVARPPQGVDPEPPRLVLDLSGARGTKPPPGSDSVQSGQVPTVPVRAVGSAAPIDPARPRGYALLAEHRRRLRRAVMRRWELAVWCAAAAVVATMAVVLFVPPPIDGLVSAPSWPLSSAGSGIPAPGGFVKPSESPDCFLVPCTPPAFDGAPTGLRIPALKVSTTLESLVVDGAGQLQPPQDYGKAGWFTQGVVPGEVGPAVIAGHVDSRKSGPAVFYDLSKLKAGDLVEVDRGSQVVTFTVTEVQQYPKNAFPTKRVYQPTPDAELRLITCGGTFDRSLRSYRDNIVVYAVRV